MRRAILTLINNSRPLEPPQAVEPVSSPVGYRRNGALYDDAAETLRPWGFRDIVGYPQYQGL
jgi:hypothetical protein